MKSSLSGSWVSVESCHFRLEQARTFRESGFALRGQVKRAGSLGACKGNIGRAPVSGFAHDIEGMLDSEPLGLVHGHCVSVIEFVVVAETPADFGTRAIQAGMHDRFILCVISAQARDPRYR